MWDVDVMRFGLNLSWQMVTYFTYGSSIFYKVIEADGIWFCFRLMPKQRNI